MALSVDGPLTSLLSPGTRKSSKVSNPSGEGGQGFRGDGAGHSFPPDSRTGLSFMGSAQSRAVVLCSLPLAAKPCQFYLLNIFPVRPFLSNASTPDLGQVFSHLEH